MYRFLLTRQWLGYAAFTLLAAAVMVLLGVWQLHRYHEHAATNARVAAAARAEPVPVGQVLAVGRAPDPSRAWTRVSATGRYDATHQVLARGRSVDGSVGFEVFTPLVLPDGSALLVDRGWLPPAAGGAVARPDIPPPTAGQVTVAGRVHLPESGASAAHGNPPEVLRVSPARLAGGMPYPLYGGYVLLDSQTPKAGGGFTAVPSDHENAWQNAGYVVQWWGFALLSIIGYGWVARRQVHQPGGDRDDATVPGGTGDRDQATAADGTGERDRATVPESTGDRATVPESAGDRATVPESADDRATVSPAGPVDTPSPDTAA